MLVSQLIAARCDTYCGPEPDVSIRTPYRELNDARHATRLLLVGQIAPNVPGAALILTENLVPTFDKRDDR